MRHNLNLDNVLLQSWPIAIQLLILVSIVSVGTFASSTSAADEDLGRTVALMARIGSSSSPSFSPDGKRIAFVSNLSGMPQVWTIGVEGGFPQLITGGDEPVGFVSWSPDGAWLAFNVAPGG